MKTAKTARSLEGKIALVTGGARGIGAATAQLLASEGCRVAIVSRSQAELEASAAQIENTFGKGCAFAFSGDISSEGTVEALFEKIKNQFGPLDILVNSAAIVGLQPFSELSTFTWDQVMAINLRGAFLCSKYAFEHFKTPTKGSKEGAPKGGAIVNISSLAGVRGTEKFKNLTAYVVSKFGIVGLTESLAVEGKEFGIRVNCIAPGAVDTEMLRKAAPFLKTQTKPGDIAEAILFFCDEKRSGKVNGSVLEIFSNG